MEVAAVVIEGGASAAPRRALFPMWHDNRRHRDQGATKAGWLT